MSSHKVEYLSVISCKEGFCKTIESFNSLIQSYDGIKISDNKIEYEGVAFEYKINIGDIDEGSKKFFHLEFYCADKKLLEKFKLFLRSIRTLLTRVGDKPPEILWDDLSKELSTAAYPVIHELENIMRKLITKFMLITVGGAWTSSVVPQDVSDSIRNKKVGAHNYLYDTDFNQLANFLFKKYATGNLNVIVGKISEANAVADLDLSQLKELVPMSNWERYFSPVIECTSEYLEVRWAKLYELRCMVAHNNFISSEEFDSIKRLASEVKSKLVDAVLNVDRIHMSATQKDEVVESMTVSMVAYDSDLNSAWNKLVDDVQLLAGTGILAKNMFKFSKLMTFRIAINELSSRNVISDELYEKLKLIASKWDGWTRIGTPKSMLEEFENLVQLVNQARFELAPIITANL